MKDFTQIIGLPVIAIHSCKKVGIVMNMQLNKDMTKICNLIISDDEDELVYLLPTKKIYNITDCVLIKNNQALSITNDQIYPNLINMDAIGLSGTNYGRIKDIELDDKFKILNFVANSNLNSKNIIQFNYDLAIFNDLNKKLKLHNFAPKSIIPKSIEVTKQAEVTIFNTVDTESFDTNTSTNTISQTSTIATPKTITARLPNNFKNPY